MTRFKKVSGFFESSHVYVIYRFFNLTILSNSSTVWILSLFNDHHMACLFVKKKSLNAHVLEFYTLEYFLELLKAIRFLIKIFKKAMKY